MRKWLQDNLRTIIITSFIIPILLVAVVSITHVISLYELSNPISWAVFLSVAIEIAALAALAGVSAKFGKFVYIPFIIVTLIQFIGNFYYSFAFIKEGSEGFKTWVDMVKGIFEPMGIEPNDYVSHKRILSFFTGGLLPFISLTFAHMLIVYSERDNNEQSTLPESEPELPEPELSDEEKELIYEMSKVVGKKNYDDYVTQQTHEVKEDELEVEETQSEIQETSEIEIVPDEEIVSEEIPENEGQKFKRLSYAKRN